MDRFNIGSRLELFVDRLLVEMLDGVAFKLHAPQPAPSAVHPFQGGIIQVTPNRLLLMYDHGGNSGKIPEYNGPRRIVGHFIETETDNV